MSWPAALLWGLMLVAVFSNGPSLLYLLFITGCFGSLQMLPGSGGATLLPQSACAALFACKVLVQRGNPTRALEAAVDPRRLALFSAFLLYAVVGAQVMPRVFANMFEVVPVSALRFGTDVLKPGAGNFTQSGYMALSYGTTLCFTIIGQTDETREHFKRALLGGAIVLVATGVVDFITYTLGIGAILDPFRNASYALLTEVEAEGAKRVVGLMPEASVYGSICVGMLSMLLFMRPFFRKGPETLVLMATMVMLTLMTILSTSSTAYVGFGVLVAIYGIDLLIRMLDPRNPRRDQINLEISLIILLIFSAFVGFMIKPTLFDPIITMVDKMVFQKASTSSFAERSMWNRVGWHAFIDSGGMGAGLGSIRVSNWAISILGSTGILGAILMFGFIAQQLLAVPRLAPPAVKTFATVVKFGLLPTLVMYQVAGTIPDIGISTAAALGMITATHMVGVRSSRPVPPFDTPQAVGLDERTAS